MCEEYTTIEEAIVTDESGNERWEAEIISKGGERVSKRNQRKSRD